MAIPIEFNLNFALNSSVIEKTFSNVNNRVKSITESMAELSNSLKSTLGIQGTDLVGDLNNLDDALKNRVLASYKNVAEESSFLRVMQKNMLSDINRGIGNVANTMNQWIDGFDFATDASNELKTSLLNLKMDPGFGKTFDEFTTNMSKMQEISSKLDPEAFKHYLDLVDKLKEAKTAEQIANINEELKALNKTAEQSAAVKALGQGLIDPFRKIGSIMSGYLSQITHAIGLYEVFTDAARAHSTAAQSVARYGINSMGDYDNQIDRVRSSLKEFTNETIRVGKETQTSLTAASQAMGELAELRISRNIDELGKMAETTTLMSKAFGVSTGEAAQFARSIVQIGGLSVTDLGTAADQLAMVQDEMGLTAGAARATMNQVGLMMRQMTTFGATGSDVAKVTREVGRLASAFEVAGLAADEANAMLNKMMDPSQISDNAMLWHGLGMSVAEGMSMMTGDVSQLEGMTERMRDLAKQLTNQYQDSPIALQEMAKAYGMTYEQVQALSKLTDEDMKKREKEAALQEAAMAARQGMTEQLQRMWGSINIILQEVVMPLMRGLSVVLESLARAAQWFSKLGDDAPKWIGWAIKGVKVLITLIGIGLIMNLMKVGKVLKSLMGGFSGLKEQVFGLAKGAKQFVKNLLQGQGPLKAIKNTLGGGAAGAAQGAGGVAQDPKAAQTINKTKPDQVSKLGQAFKSFPSPAQILAVAVAIVALGAAISGIILSISVLANTMKDFEWQEMLVFFVGIAAVVAILMWGMVSAIGALGAIGAAAAPGILAAAAAIFALGIAVGIIILSLAVLVAALSMTDGILGKLIGLALGIAFFAGVMAAMAPVMAVAIPIMYALSGALIMLGAAMILMGVGLQLIVGSFERFVGLLSEMSADQMAGVVQVIGTLVITLFSLAGALLVAGAAMLGFAAFTAPFLIAIGVMAAGIVIMALLGRATTQLAENMSMLGTGLQLIAENASKAMNELANLMAFFQTDQIAAMEDFASRFAEQMQKISESIIQFQVSVMVAGVAGFIGGLLSKISGVAQGATASSEDNQTGAVVEQLIESNEHLEQIRKNTSENIVLMKRLIASNRRVEMGIDFAR